MNDSSQNPSPSDPALAAESTPTPRREERPAQPPRATSGKPEVLEGLGRVMGALRQQKETGEVAELKAPKESKPRSSYPPPRITRQMSPELEQELAAALEGQSLEEMLAQPAAPKLSNELEPDARVSGQVVSIHNENVFVDLGGPVQGLVQLKSFAEPPEIGATLELIVVRFQADEGLYEMRLPGAAVSVSDWADIEEGTIVQAVITGHNKGGLECSVSGAKAFMPVSQVSLYRVEDLEQFVGESWACLVTESNPEKRNLVLSRRAVLEFEQAEAKQQLLKELEAGQTREGVVRSLMDFGAFVDLGGVDGLIHISQLSWDRVTHPSEVLTVGQQVKVKVEKFDPETGKVSLSYRETFDNPWDKAEANYPPHSTASGVVTRVADFGAFVKLEPGIEGLIHISELAHQRVRRASDIVSEGQQVDVQILTVDRQAQRISLSLKALVAAPTPVDKGKEAEDKAIAEIEAKNKPVKPSGPLKGGIGSPSGGEQFGLKW